MILGKQSDCVSRGDLLLAATWVCGVREAACLREQLVAAAVTAGHVLPGMKPPLPGPSDAAASHTEDKITSSRDPPASLSFSFTQIMRLVEV